MNLPTHHDYSDTDLRAALQTCDAEPIHMPGAIQPCGALLRVDPAALVITHASANLRAYFDCAAEAAIGRALYEVTDPGLQTYVLEYAQRGPRSQPTGQRMRVAGHDLDVVLHWSGGAIIVELEEIPPAHRLDPDAIEPRLRHFLAGLREAQGLTALFDHLVQEVRALTGYDRVKLYQFDKDWNGEVVAEARTPEISSYKGLHFPASDIPAQARRLYTLNPIRHIFDVDYTPVPLLPAAAAADERPVDLSFAVLRSVSPIHTQYLANMNVRASMSVSILRDGQLWGLVSCHHRTPLHVHYRMRMVAELYGMLFASQLNTMLLEQEQAERQRGAWLSERLREALGHVDSLRGFFAEQDVNLRLAFGAHGVAFCSRADMMRSGHTPEEPALRALLSWLDEHSPGVPFATEDCQEEFAGEAALQGISGGLLAVPYSPVDEQYIVWFRDPIVRSVNWAGTPEKALEDTRGGFRLTPRSSFELWKQEVRNRCAPWTEADLEAGRAVGLLLMENERLFAEQAMSRQAQFFADINHEMRNPMAAIVSAVEVMQRDSGLGPAQRRVVDVLAASSESLIEIVNNVLDISKIESAQFEIQSAPYDLRAVLEKVRRMYASRAEDKGLALEVKVSPRLPEHITGDAARMQQVLVNLVGNAMKFTEQGRVRLEAALDNAERAAPRLVLRVSDTGIGIPPEQQQRIFDKFAQADESISETYGGTGLGLAISRGLIQRMGGGISLHSRPGQGSTFELRLPL